ncbi:MAG: uracil-DNA glycosylase [Archaeoglobi archaeon]|nr:uracil-DNA glycosylase [Archaeoglobi archaeon]
MAESLEDIVRDILSCRNCSLYLTKKNYVPGEGSERAQIMFVGEAPGREEDEQGRPFVGNAGKLLTALIENELGLSRKDVYITNILKCRPPNNRDPTEEEIDACFPYLARQIEVIRPDVIVCLGRHAAKTIFEYFEIPFTTISRERGVLKEKIVDGRRVLFMATYHPAAALYRPPLRQVIEEDFRKLRGLIKRKNTTLFDFFS